MKLLLRIFATLVVACVFLVAGLYLTTPKANTAQQHFDTILVLGYPANLDETPSPEQRERVLEAIREYRAGVAPRLIMSGGAAHNAFTEAHVMASFAASQGVPATDILEEPHAHNTLQNIAYSAQLMHQHGWTTAEIVSSPSHLPRAALILAAFDRAYPAFAIGWRTHPAGWPPEYGPWHRLAIDSGEAVYCLRLRLQGIPIARLLPYIP